MATVTLSPLPLTGVHHAATAVNLPDRYPTSSYGNGSTNAGPAHNIVQSPLPIFQRTQGVPKVPVSSFSAQIHPLAQQIGHEVEQYFLGHWNFGNDKERAVFLKAGFPRVTCLYFPEAKDDRIGCACRLLTILFLVDDLLEHMSLAEGEAYNNTIMEIMRGTLKADRSRPEQYIMSDLCDDMRRIDTKLAEETLEATYIFMRAQTHKDRLTISDLKQYFFYRQDDVGQKLLAALMQFTMDLHVSPAEREILAPFEQHCGQHISIVNDILSWEKEVKAAASINSEGAVICSCVQVLATETGLGIQASKRVLWTIAREVENAFIDDASALQLLSAASPAEVNGAGHKRPEVMSRDVSPDNTAAYIRGLVHQMGGNERWSLETKRYHDI